MLAWLVPPPCTMPMKPDLRIRPKGSSWGKRQRPRLPQDLPWTSSCLSFSDQAPAEQDTPQTPSEQHGALNQCLPSWHSCRTHHRCLPTPSIHPALQRSHQSRSFAREQKKQRGVGRDREDPQGCAARETLVAGFSCCDCYSPTYTPG